MELLHRGVLYTFEYDYAPNNEVLRPAFTKTRSGRILAGSVHVTFVYRNGRFDRPAPVSVEVLRLMEDAAAEDAIASGCPTVDECFLRSFRPARPRRSRQSPAAGSLRE